jgi:predicted phosphodiesterase
MNKAEIIRLELDAMPEKPSAMAIARMLCAKYPETFSDIEGTRSNIRYVIGSMGTEKRGCSDTRYFKPENTSKLFTFEDGEHFDRSPFVLPESVRKIAVIADMQFPYHDKPAILTALEFADKKEVDAIIINGDGMDNYQLSRFVKDPGARDLAYERDLFVLFLRELRAYFPKKRIIYKFGNHELRWENWLKAFGPQLWGIKDFRLHELLPLRELQIDFVADKRLIKFGKLNIIHGHEYKGGSGGVNPARWLYLRTSANAVCGHFHRISQHLERDVTGKQIGCWSIGCLCDLNPYYMPYNGWAHGFGYGEIIDEHGHFRFANKEIADYKVT